MALHLFYPGNVYISDCNNNRIRKYTASTGIITRFAGGGTDYDYEDSSNSKGDNGAATSAILSSPRQTALDSAGRRYYSICNESFLLIFYLFSLLVGNLYIADKVDAAIRKVTMSSGIIITVAGTFINGFSGDGIQATSATLSEPNGVALDSAGKNTVLSLL